MDMFQWLQEKRPQFDGKTYVSERDHERLSSQLMRVLQVMQDGQWRTLSEIADITRSPQASVSARIRDLRKEKFGAFRVNRRHLSKGLFQYQIERKDDDNN